MVDACEDEAARDALEESLLAEPAAPMSRAQMVAAAGGEVGS